MKRYQCTFASKNLTCKKNEHGMSIRVKGDENRSDNDRREEDGEDEKECR